MIRLTRNEMKLYELLKVPTTKAGLLCYMYNPPVSVSKIRMSSLKHRIDSILTKLRLAGVELSLEKGKYSLTNPKVEVLVKGEYYYKGTKVSKRQYDVLKFLEEGPKTSLEVGLMLRGMDKVSSQRGKTCVRESANRTFTALRKLGFTVSFNKDTKTYSDDVKVVIKEEVRKAMSTTPSLIADIIDRIPKCNVKIDTRTVYSALHELRRDGVIITDRPNRKFGYYSLKEGSLEEV